MFCHKCGKQNENTKFCIYCGAELLSAEPVVPKPPTEPVVSEPPAEPAATMLPTEPVVSEPPAEPAATMPPTEPVVSEPPAEPAATTPPTEPVVSEPPAEPAATAPPTEPVMSEPSTEPFVNAPPMEPFMSIPPTESYRSVPPTEPYRSVPPTEPFMGAPPVVQMMGTQPEERPPKKRKTGLIIGIIAAVLAVLAGAAALMFFMMTYPVEGQWYNEERGEVLVFGEDGTVSVISFLGTQDEAFSYSRLKGEGSFSIDKTSYGFEADDQEMTIDDLGTYWKADDGFSVSDFLDEYGKLGTWYCEERGEVLVFDTEGALQRIRLTGSQDSNYEYGYEDGSGTLMMGETSYDFSLDDGQIDIADIGVYIQADDEFASGDFIDEYGQLGTWYCEERGEVLVFNMDGTLKSRHSSNTNTAAFEYDREANAVTMTMGPFSYGGLIEDGQLIFEDMGTFMQAEDGFDEDIFFEDFGNSILGIWYDAEGELIIDLHDDGTYDAFSYGTAMEGTYTERSGGVTITYDIFDLDFDEEYTLVNGELVKGDDPKISNAADTLTREAIEQLGEDDYYDDVMGSWVPLYGSGTLTFSDETHVTLYGSSTYSGTYSYDPFTGIGYIYMLSDELVFVTDGDILYWIEVIFYRS